jgi:hypothetical protein
MSSGRGLDAKTSRRHTGKVARAKATVYIDPEVLRTMRVHAARTGKRDSDVVEEALREYLGLALLERIWENADRGEEEALKLAYEELRAARAERRQRAR